MTMALDRRDFFKTAAGTLALLLSDRGLTAAQTPAQAAPAGPPVAFGVVGLGTWGRDILATLGRMSTARVEMICDTYEPFLKRSASAAPAATSVTDFRRMLDSPAVEAIVVATPTPTHKDIVLACLEAGKHVYCEAPLAATIEDARAVADAATRRPKQIFQAGLQGRANSLYRHVSQFVKSGVLGDVALVNAQWNKKESWRRAGPTPEREREINWRLLDGSPGLMGEVAIHQIDLMAQYLGAYPSAITGFGSLVGWSRSRILRSFDAAIEILRGHGITSALLHGGTSSVHALGAPLDDSAWHIAWKPPEGVQRTFDLRDSALSVSAVHGKAFEAQGRVYGHVMDPRAGAPTTAARAVAVVGSASFECDALSTALLVLGADWLAEFGRRFPHVSAVVV